MLYPRQNEARTVMDLSGIWRFSLGDENFCESCVTLPLASPMTIAVPASYNDQKEGEAFRDHYGWVYYETGFSLPKALEKERIVLRFGAVTQCAKVYVDGAFLCEHKGGFLPFEKELSGLTSGLHRLTVAVDNRVDLSTLPVGSEKGGNMLTGLIPDMPGVTPKKQNYPNFDFFNYCGIPRPVKLYTTPKSYICDITIVPTICGTDARVDYEISVCGEGEASVTICDESGTSVAEVKGNKGSLIIKNAHLWEPLCAYLYNFAVSFGEDRYTEPFGVRTVAVAGTDFLINGKPFYFKGFGKHEDSSIRGRGIDEVLNVKDIALMKWMGANSFRTSHYPYSEEMMYLCDREGI
ncbi:MAG: beta-glucuronidase, partial [Clostridia bacterium]|nr:beta-glucuronidase [Clostridia bacterium]